MFKKIAKSSQYNTGKGKGPNLSKLRTIQLIEANLQLMTKIFIGERSDENIVKDERLLKYNCRSRRNYSIDIAILGKRLICNIAV